jgi:hypothetical protein
MKIIEIQGTTADCQLPTADCFRWLPEEARERLLELRLAMRGV